MRRLLTLTIMPLLMAGQTSNPLRDFFEKRISQGGEGTMEERVGTAEQAEKYDQALVSLAMPTIMTALKDSDLHVSLDAGLTLVSIARRPDSGVLLRPWHRDLVALLDRKDTRYAAVAMMIFETEVPLPKDVVPSLTQFVMDDSKPNDSKPDIIHGVMRLDPDSPQTIAAMRHLLSMPLDGRTRVNALNVTGGAHSGDETLIGLVAKYLYDSDVSVRATAIQTLTRMGPAAVAKTAVELGQIANKFHRT